MTTPYERRFEEPFSGPTILFRQKVENQPISTKDRASPSVLSGFFEGFDALYAAGKLGRRRSVLQENQNNFIFRFVNGSEKLARKSSEVGPSDPIRQDIEEGVEHRSDLQGETDKLDSVEQQRGQDELEAKYDFWSVSGSFNSRNHVQE